MQYKEGVVRKHSPFFICGLCSSQLGMKLMHNDNCRVSTY